MRLPRLLLTFLRPRHSFGFGIQSPYAFWFLKQVLRQSSPYYKYSELAVAERRLSAGQDEDWPYEPRHQRRLLFRLVNEAQPETIVDVGRLSASSLYLQAAKTTARYKSSPSFEALCLEADEAVDFLYLHDHRHPDHISRMFDLCVQHKRERSMFVIEGIRFSKDMTRAWEQMKHHPDVSLTFDLYNLGILFFNPTLNHCHYTTSY